MLIYFIDKTKQSIDVN